MYTYMCVVILAQAVGMRFVAHALFTLTQYKAEAIHHVGGYSVIEPNHSLIHTQKKYVIRLS